MDQIFAQINQFSTLKNLRGQKRMRAWATVTVFLMSVTMTTKFYELRLKIAYQSGKLRLGNCLAVAYFLTKSQPS